MAGGEPIKLWPGVAPGDKGDIGEEHDTTQDPKTKVKDDIIRLGNGPGAIALTVTPCGASSCASALVSPSTPAFAAQ